jgi:capsid assembly protease
MSNEKSVKVSNTDDLRLALAAGYEASQIEITHPSNESVIAKARAEGVAEGQKAAAETAITSERKRIADIQSMGRPGFDAELKAAIDSGASPEAFAMSMLKAAQDRGITLEAIRKDAPPAAPHAKPGDTQGGGKKLKSSSEVFAARRQASATAAAAAAR